MRQLLRVLTRAPTHDLTTVEMVRAELGLTEPDSTVDTRLSYLITQASSAISGYCNRVFGAEQIQELFWPESWWETTDCLVLARQPIIDIETVIVDGQTLDPTEYDFDVEKSILYFVTAGVPRAWRCFRTADVTYNGGYELMDLLPEAIERACLNIVQGGYFAQGRDLNMRSETVPDVYSYTFGGGVSGAAGSGTAGLISPDIAALLAPYRNYPPL